MYLIVLPDMSSEAVGIQRPVKSDEPFPRDAQVPAQTDGEMYFRGFPVAKGLQPPSAGVCWRPQDLRMSSQTWHSSAPTDATHRKLAH